MTEASARKTFLATPEGQSYITRIVLDEEVRATGKGDQSPLTRTANVSELPEADRAVLLDLFGSLTRDLPEEAFEGREKLVKAMRDRLARQSSKESRGAAKYKFDVSSCELTLPRLARIGSLEISGGELDACNLLGKIAGLVIACTLADCFEAVAEMFGLQLESE
jgi:hypothetical protein